MVLESAETRHQAIPGYPVPPAALTALRHWPHEKHVDDKGRPIQPWLPAETAPHDASLLVFVNDGRWLVECPCGNAQWAARSDHRFFCVECLNAWCGGRWAPVLWPDNVAAIEAALEVRPPHNRHWRAGETVEDLADENAEHQAEIDAYEQSQPTPGERVPLIIPRRNPVTGALEPA